MERDGDRKLLAWAIGATPAQAQLATQHIKGIIGLKGGSPPPPGTYVIAPLFMSMTPTRSGHEPANEDGSVDIYCGPKAPAGFEKNWIPTVPGKNWFAYFRFYQPTETYFDRSWPLPSFEQV